MKQETIVFLGPSLPKSEAQQICPNALFLPPARCGDILHVLRWKPKKIAIIDGYFEQVGAIWHKEILYAIDQDVAVFGAASMGALRAAELADLGMHGVGHIFQDFYNGRLTDDDEVTVMHLPEQSNYTSVSIAMVNIRATIHHALASNIIHQTTADLLINCAKQLFYPKRQWQTIIEQTKKIQPNEVAVFSEWLQQIGTINQKAIDAKELLQLLENETDIPKTAKPNTPPSLFLKTLLSKTCCQSFPIFHSEIPENEQVVTLARLLGAPYLEAKMLANLLLIVDALADYYHIPLQETHTNEFDNHLARIYLLIEKFPQQNTQYETYTQYYLNQTHHSSMTTLIASLWYILDQHIEKSELNLHLFEVQNYANDFRRKYNLRNTDKTMAWFKERELTLESFTELMKVFCRFEYFAVKRNFDAIQIKVNTNIWWLEGALKLNGAYRQAQELLSDPTKKSQAIAAIQQQAQIEREDYLLDLDLGYENL